MPTTERPLEALARIDQVLLARLDRVREDTGAERASLFLRDPATGEAVTRVAHLPEVEEIRLAAGQGVVGAVMTSGRAMTWPGDAPHPEPPPGSDFQVRSLVALPVRIGPRVVGVLEVLNLPLGALSHRRAIGAVRSLEWMLSHSSLAPQLVPRTQPAARLDFRYEGVVGSSPAMEVALRDLERVVATSAPVHLTGEPGTGKELLAWTVHKNSPRASGPFVKVACSSLPAALRFAELFGPDFGFGARDARIGGRVAQADGGTLFLKDVDALSPATQECLFRALMNMDPVRRREARPPDIRLVTSTCRRVEPRVRAGLFRDDFFQWISGVTIRLPPLRERGPEDIRRLLDHFVEIHSHRHERVIREIPLTTVSRVTGYSWPGNVLELSVAVEEAVLQVAEGVLEPHFFEITLDRPSSPFDDLPPIEVLVNRYLGHLMATFQGRRLEVARVAGISRATLWRRLKDLGYE
jgi:Nif-specific regulatory protein